jgi:hypothetical protein
MFCVIYVYSLVEDSDRRIEQALPAQRCENNGDGMKEGRKEGREKK